MAGVFVAFLITINETWEENNDWNNFSEVKTVMTFGFIRYKQNSKLEERCNGRWRHLSSKTFS